MQNQKTMPYGAGSLTSSENDMMAAVLASSLGQSLDTEHLTRYERLCQAAEHIDLVPHALPKEHMVRDFTQWFHGWLVQNEQMIQRRERAQAVYDEFTAEPIVMGPAEDKARDWKNTGKSEHALVLVKARMPACSGE